MNLPYSYLIGVVVLATSLFSNLLLYEKLNVEKQKILRLELANSNLNIALKNQNTAIEKLKKREQNLAKNLSKLKQNIELDYSNLIKSGYNLSNDFKLQKSFEIFRDNLEKLP